MTMTVFGGQVNENRMADGVMKHAMICGNLVDSSLIRVEPFCFDLPVSLISDIHYVLLFNSTSGGAAGLQVQHVS